MEKIANYSTDAQHKLAPLSKSKLYVNRILIISDTGTLLICLPGKVLLNPYMNNR